MTNLKNRKNKIIVLIFREIKPNLLNSSCLALGMFDGVHVGHQKVIRSAVSNAAKYDAVSTIVTFSKHPKHVKSKTQPRLITTFEEKLEIFKSMGIKAVVVFDFTDEFSHISAENYLKTFLIEGLNAKSISIGYNHHFGENKKGDSNLLKQYSSILDYDLQVSSPVAIDGHVVSSSTIRKHIHAGEVDFAAKMLGRNYSITNIVVEGKQRGRLLGFPTANLNLPPEKACPKAGVYLGSVDIDGENYYSVINVGKRPTYGDLIENIIEAHIIDFDRNIYNREITVSFIKRIRDEQKFLSETELKNQIEQDYLVAKKLYK
jgi:riboflavin kinase/FMN adenylyltransferase